MIDEVAGHVTTFTPDATDLLERRLTMGGSTAFGEEDLVVLPACDLTALTTLGFTSRNGDSTLKLAPEVRMCPFLVLVWSSYESLMFCGSYPLPALFD
jgi:hypothetical protein